MNNFEIKSLAPIIVFAFIRKDTLERVINSLKKNYLSKDSHLFIFIDGPRNDNDTQLSTNVKKYCESVDGFKSITIHTNKINKGLDPSIIDGVTEIINKFGKAIILEDDIITAPNFLNYMNFCLDKFENDDRIMSVSGWGIDMKIPSDYKYDAFLLGRSSSWGWATWKNRWQSIDWDIHDWNKFKKDKKSIKSFNRYGGEDMFSMLKKCMNGGNMWDIRFCYNMFKMNKYSIVPLISKTKNIGFDEFATHCKPVKFKRYTTRLDDGKQTSFNIPSSIKPDIRLIKERLKISSLKIRLITKLRNIIGF